MTDQEWDNLIKNLSEKFVTRILHETKEEPTNDQAVALVAISQNILLFQIMNGPMKECQNNVQLEEMLSSYLSGLMIQNKQKVRDMFDRMKSTEGKKDDKSKNH